MSLENHAITIMDAIRSEHDELWVLNVNRMAVNAHSDSSRVSLHIDDNNRLMIEASFIPQNLVEIGDRDVIVNSAPFKRAVNSGLLLIIDPEAANKFMERSDARAEHARIQNIRNEVINASMGIENGGSGKTPAALGDRNRKPIRNPDAENDVVIANQINPVILNIMVQAKDMNMDAVHASIKNCGDERLSAADYRYVFEEASKIKNFDKLARWAERQMLRKQSSPVDADEYEG